MGFPIKALSTEKVLVLIREGREGEGARDERRERFCNTGGTPLGRLKVIQGCVFISRDAARFAGVLYTM